MKANEIRYFTGIYIKRLRKTKKKLRMLFETDAPKDKWGKSQSRQSDFKILEIYLSEMKAHICKVISHER